MIPSHPLSGYRVVVSRHLAGSRRAVASGDTLYVSPAMYELIVNADESELRLILENLVAIQIPELPGIHAPLPATMKPPEVPDFMSAGAIARRLGL